MFDVTCLDSFGNVVNTFTQWDINQTLYIEDSAFDIAPIFHFCNQNTEKAICVPSEFNSDGVLTVKVPNQLLIEPYPVIAYVYMGSGGSFKTVEYLRFPLRTRPQPQDFLFEENVEFVLLQDLIEEVKGLNEAVTEAETERMHNETIRITNENTRIQAEKERETAEASREKAEAERNAAENLRKENENNREEAETERTTAEANRNDAEQKRTDNENARQDSEKQRIENESKRAENEDTRITAETARDDAESIREFNEQQRIANESARNDAEAERIAEFNSMTDAINDKIAEANQIIEDNGNAKSNADAAAVSAKDAADSALLSKSYANGGTGIRDGEDTDNSKFYCQNAHGYRDEAEQFSQSATDAVEQINKKLQMPEFDIDDDGNLICTADNPYEFAIDDDGMLRWRVKAA